MTQGWMLLVASVAVVYACYRIKDKYFRLRGVRVERRAVATIRLPSAWELRADVPVPRLGNCDVLITAPRNQRFAVEIKSGESAKKVWFSFFTNDEIRKENGDRFPRNHIAQVMNVAKSLDAQPVLWFPLAKKSRRFKTRSGVIVVVGGHKQLERAIGARWGWL